MIIRGNKTTVNQELKMEEGLQIHHTCFKYILLP